MAVECGSTATLAAIGARVGAQQRWNKSSNPLKK
jgi:hypothetical protein